MRFVTLVAFTCAMMASACAQDNTVVASAPAAEEISVVRLIMVNHVDLSSLVDALGGSVISLFGMDDYGSTSGNMNTTQTVANDARTATVPDTPSPYGDNDTPQQSLQKMRDRAAERIKNRALAPY